MKEAACAGKDPTTKLFFPDRGDFASGAKAQMICMSCPVRKQCREYKEATGSTDGIWFGEYSKRKTG